MGEKNKRLFTLKPKNKKPYDIETTQKKTTKKNKKKDKKE